MHEHLATVAAEPCKHGQGHRGLQRVDNTQWMVKDSSGLNSWVRTQWVGKNSTNGQGLNGCLGTPRMVKDCRKKTNIIFFPADAFEIDDKSVIGLL